MEDPSSGKEPLLKSTLGLVRCYYLTAELPGQLRRLSLIDSGSVNGWMARRRTQACGALQKGRKVAENLVRVVVVAAESEVAPYYSCPLDEYLVLHMVEHLCQVSSK